eukprot:UN31600
MYGRGDDRSETAETNATDRTDVTAEGDFVTGGNTTKGNTYPTTKKLVNCPSDATARTNVTDRTDVSAQEGFHITGQHLTTNGGPEQRTRGMSKEDPTRPRGFSSATPGGERTRGYSSVPGGEEMRGRGMSSIPGGEAMRARGMSSIPGGEANRVRGMSAIPEGGSMPTGNTPVKKFNNDDNAESLTAETEETHDRSDIEINLEENVEEPNIDFLSEKRNTGPRLSFDNALGENVEVSESGWFRKNNDESATAEETDEKPFKFSI